MQTSEINISDLKSDGYQWFLNQATQQDYLQIFGNTPISPLDSMGSHLWNKRSTFNEDVKQWFFNALDPNNRKLLYNYLNNKF